MKTKFSTVDEYFDAAPAAGLPMLTQLRAVIRSVVPKAGSEEVISYQMPAFRYLGRGLVAYACWHKHCGLYPMNASLVAKFEDELKDFETAKGTIRFPHDRKLPVTLIKKLVKARVEENRLRAAPKKKST